MLIFSFSLTVLESGLACRGGLSTDQVKLSLTLSPLLSSAVIVIVYGLDDEALLSKDPLITPDTASIEIPLGRPVAEKLNVSLSISLKKGAKLIETDCPSIDVSLGNAELTIGVSLTGVTVTVTVAVL